MKTNGMISIALGLGTLITTAAFAQGTWIELHPATQPPAREGFALAFDEARGVAVLFGGQDPTQPGSLLSDTWEFGSLDWSERFPAHHPPARSFHAMAYDSARGRTVLFGGSIEGGQASGTWVWDGTDWAEVFPSANPPDRVGHAMAYDRRRGQVVLFGGDSNGPLADTWEWNGSQWTERAPVLSPPARAYHAMTFDRTFDRIMLFGGETCDGNPCSNLADTWGWQGQSWFMVGQVLPPMLPRIGSSMAFDPYGRGIVLFGGGVQTEACSDTPWDDTWQWITGQWSWLPPVRSPGPRRGHAMFFDSVRGRLTLFGGSGIGGADPCPPEPLNDLWVLFPPLHLTGIVPSLGSESGGDMVSLLAAPLSPAAQTTVTIGGVEAPVLGVLPDRVVVHTPPGTGSAQVILRNEFGTASRSYQYIAPERAARLGNVNVRLGDRESVLWINGTIGDVDRELTLSLGQRLDVYLFAPPSRAESRFALYVWAGTPDATTVTPLPRGLGAMVFPTPFTAGAPQPLGIFNNLGHPLTLGVPTAPSTAAPSLVLTRRRGVARPADMAFQGIIEDDGSPISQGVSITNAVIVHVVR